MADRRYQGSSSRRGAKGQGGYRGQGGYIGKMSQDRSPKSRNSRGGQKGGRGRGAGRPQRPAPVRSDMLMIEGRRAVAEALDTGVKLTRAYVSAPDGDASLQELMSRLEAANVPIEEVSHRELDARSSHGAHQGIMVKCAPFAYASVRDIINRAGEGPALVVLLDHVTDEGNFGAIVRSAEVAGADGVIIANARAAQVGVGAMKTSAGALLHIPVAQVPNLVQAMQELKDAGFWCCAATEHAEEDVWHAPLEGRICLVMGSEGSGISHLVLSKCDFAVRLPQRGHVESLNVAQAATVLCYEWLRRDMERTEEPGGNA